MIYISGYGLPSNKPLLVSLTAIHGIGQNRAKDICESVGIPHTRKAKTLTKKEMSAITKVIESNYVIGADLKRKTRNDIARLIEIQCYRGRRHQSHLPVRGQRTKTNAKTQKRLARGHILQA